MGEYKERYYVGGPWAGTRSHNDQNLPYPDGQRLPVKAGCCGNYGWYVVTEVDDGGQEWVWHGDDESAATAKTALDVTAEDIASG